MIHAVIMTRDKFKTACGTRFHGTLLKGKTFHHLTVEELNSIQCDTCRNKVTELRNKPVYLHRGGRSILIDLLEE